MVISEFEFKLTQAERREPGLRMKGSSMPCAQTMWMVFAESYSYRSATMGSTLLARRAGT